MLLLGAVELLVLDRFWGPFASGLLIRAQALSGTSFMIERSQSIASFSLKTTEDAEKKDGEEENETGRRRERSKD